MPTENADNRGDVTDTDGQRTVVAGTPVVVRRHAGVAALVGATASAVAIAYLWRASQTMTVLDWALCGVMAVIAAIYLSSLVDSRTPLLVADDLGVRIRLGDEWRGLPWDAIGQVTVHPRRGRFRDGRLVFTPRSLGRALEGLDGRGRRHAAANQKMYGAALAVPVGITTRVSAGGQSIADQIDALALGRAEVVEVAQESTEPGKAPKPVKAPKPEKAPKQPKAAKALQDTEARIVTGPVEEAPAEPTPGTATSLTPGHDDPAPSGTPALAGLPADGTADDGAEREPAARPQLRSILGGIGTIVSRVAKGRGHDVDADRSDLDAADAADTADDADAPGQMPPAGAPTLTAASALPLRETRPGQRAEITRDAPATLGNAALFEALEEADAGRGLPEARELRRPGSVDLVFERSNDRVRPISTLGDPVEPLVIDDFVTEPAYDPVVGPEITAARTRLGLSVDELADRTRIRPHVIESIEVDDFAPCGGDFYARGHLRTLARVLGKDPAPLLEKFEERYATAPINARRVFEAELATGMTGSMRSTVGGPNWGLMIGVVLSLVLVWGVVRLFTSDPAEIIQSPAPVLNGSAGVDSGYAAAPQPPAPASGPVAEPVAVQLTAAQADAKVTVRDGEGRVVFSGEMVIGERKRLDVTPPVHVRTGNGGALEIIVDGKDKGPLGELGTPTRRTFR